MRGILILVTLSLVLQMALMILPVLVGFSVGEDEDAFRLLVISMLGGGVAALCALAILGRERGLRRKYAPFAVFVVWFFNLTFTTGICWLAFSLDGSEAVFEAAAALTTSSFTRLPDFPDISQTHAVARATLEWYGGFLTLASILYVLAPTGLGGLPQLDARFSEGERDPGNDRHLVYIRQLFVRYAVITIIVLMVLTILGTSFNASFFLAAATMATGGYVPLAGALETHIGPIAQIALAVMLAGSASGMFWLRYRRADGLRSILLTRETEIILAIVAALTLVYLARLTGVSAGIEGAVSIAAFAEALLAAVSLVSTAGMETRFGVIALAPPLVVLFVLLVGASVLSSAGGVKIYRVLAMARLSLRELLQLIYPSMVSRRRRLRTFYSEVSIVTVCTVFVGFLMTIAAGTVILNATELPFDAAFTLAVTAISNAGPVYESLAPASVSDIDWPPVLRLSDLQLVVTAILMILGRLEILLFIIVIGLRFWRQS